MNDGRGNCNVSPKMNIQKAESKKNGFGSNEQSGKEDQRSIDKQGFLSKADFKVQNMLSSFFSNVEDQDFSDSVIENKLMQIKCNKSNISKNNYNSSSDSSPNDKQSNSNKAATSSQRQLPLFLKIPSSKSNKSSFKGKGYEIMKLQKTKTQRSGFSKKESDANSPSFSSRSRDILNNINQDSYLRQNEINKKKVNLVTKSTVSQKTKSFGNFLSPLPKININGEHNDLLNIIPMTQKSIHSLRSICSEIHDNINIKSQNILKEAFQLPTDRSGKEYDEEKGDHKDSLSDFKAMNTIEINQKEFPFRRLLKGNNKVYDSLSEDEDIEINSDYIINPYSPFKLTFDGILVLLTISSFIYIPLHIAYIHYNTNTISFIFIINIFIDIYYIIDICLSFCTAFYDFEEQLIKKFPLITEYYLTNWFFIDFISGIPINTIIDSHMLLNPKSDFTIATFSIYANHDSSFIHLLKCFRLIKGIKIAFNNSFLKYCVDNFFQSLTYSKWTMLYISLISFVIFVHLFASLFVFLGFAYYPSWIETKGMILNQHVDIYVTSFYFICITVFGIGYGDIVPVNIKERIFSLFLLVVGVMIYSWAVSALSSYSEPNDEKINEYKAKMAIFEHIKHANDNMTANLTKKVKRFLNYNLEHEQFNSGEILEQLPTKLRNEVIYEMYKSILDNFIFFKSFQNNDFSIKVLLSFKAIILIKHEMIVTEGEYLEEMFFVKRGSLVLELPIPSMISEEIDKTITLGTLISNVTNNLCNETKVNLRKTSIVLNKNYTKASFLKKQEKEEKFLSYERQYVRLIEIRRNEHFGDIMMFLNQRCPLRGRVKSIKAELYLLKKADAVNIIMSFPKIWRKIIRKSIFNYEQLNRLIKKTLKFFFINNQRFLYSMEKRYNLISKPNYNDTQITDFAFRNANNKNNDLNSNNSSNGLATIPSMSASQDDDNDDNNKKPNPQFPGLVFEEEYEGDLKNTESSMTQLIPERKIDNKLKRIQSTHTLQTQMNKNFKKQTSINVTTQKKTLNPISNVKELITLKHENTNYSQRKKNEFFDDSKSKISFDFQDQYNPISVLDRTGNTFISDRSQFYNRQMINSEFLSGEMLTPYDDDPNRIISITKDNDNINISLIKQNYTKLFHDAYKKKRFETNIKPVTTNCFEVISYSSSIKQNIISNEPSSLLVKKQKSMASKQLFVPINNVSSLRRGSYQFLNSEPLSPSKVLRDTPSFDFNLQKKNDNNILLIPGMGNGGLTGNEDGNISSRSHKSENASYRSIFDSSKKKEKFGGKISSRKSVDIFATPNLKGRGLPNTALQKIGENIHMNSVNLNNPSLFYSTAFNNIINEQNALDHENKVNKKLEDKTKIDKKLGDLFKMIKDND